MTRVNKKPITVFCSDSVRRKTPALLTITINSGTYESYGAITVAMHDQEGHLLINGGTFLVSAPPDANTGRWSLNSYATDTVVKGGFFTQEIDVRYAPYALQGGYYAQNPAKWIA